MMSQVFERAVPGGCDLRDRVSRGRSAVRSSQPSRRVGAVVGSAAAVTFLVAATLATTGAGRSGVGAVVLHACSMAVLAAAAVSCLARAALRSDERPAWMLIGLSFAAWFAGDVFYYWTSVLPAISVDVAYFAFYGLAALGIALLLHAEGIGRAAVVDAAIAVAGMATVWGWLVWEPIHLREGGSTLAMTAYPIADLVLAATALGALQATRWRLSSRWTPIAVGFAAIACADSAWLVASAHGAYMGGTALDLVWPAGELCVGVGAWLRVPARREANFTAGTLSFAIAGFAGLGALVVLLADHFERLRAIVVVAAAVTLVLGGIRAAVSHFQGLAGERSLRLAAVRLVHALATTVDARDHYTRDHSKQVSHYAQVIATFLGASGSRLDRIGIAGELHDIGKIAVPDAVLLKDSALTTSEFETIKRHPIEGERIARSAGLDEIAPWIRHHHERWDGLGYPDGLRGEEIPIEARILAVADALEAMTENRAYRPKLTLDEAKREIASAAGRQFDPVVARVAITMIDRRLLVAGTTAPAPAEVAAVEAAGDACLDSPNLRRRSLLPNPAGAARRRPGWLHRNRRAITISTGRILHS